MLILHKWSGPHSVSDFWPIADFVSGVCLSYQVKYQKLPVNANPEKVCTNTLENRTHLMLVSSAWEDGEVKKMKKKRKKEKSCYTLGMTIRTARLPGACNLLGWAGEDLSGLPNRARHYHFFIDSIIFQFKHYISSHCDSFCFAVLQSQHQFPFTSSNRPTSVS